MQTPMFYAVLCVCGGLNEKTHSLLSICIDTFFLSLPSLCVSASHTHTHAVEHNSNRPVVCVCVRRVCKKIKSCYSLTAYWRVWYTLAPESVVSDVQLYDWWRWVCWCVLCVSELAQFHWHRGGWERLQHFSGPLTGPTIHSIKRSFHIIHSIHLYI